MKIRKTEKVVSLCRAILGCLLLVIAMSFSVNAETIEEIQVLKVDAQNEMVVIKASDGEMKILKVGDVFAGNGKIIEIAEGRIVIKEMTNLGIETVIIRVKGNKQSVERIRKVGEKGPSLYVPQSMDDKHDLNINNGSKK